MTDIILKNLKRNLQNKGKVCVICGKRFIPNKYKPNSVCCSEDCGWTMKLIKKRDNYNENVN